MTVDIARADNTAIATLSSSNEALARLGQWVAAARDAHALVSPLVDTAFVPEAYKPKVDPRATAEQKDAARAVAVANATAAVLQGITLGLDPLTALQQIYIVHGRPGMYAKLMVALVQSRGHEVWVEDISDTRCVVAGRRKGSDHIERVVVTMDQARKAGWTSNQNYTKTPQDMLYARAAGRVCNHIASDVLMGIASVEEIQDEIKATAEVGNGHRTVEAPTRQRLAVNAKRAAARAAAETAEVVEDPSLDDEPDTPAPEPDPEPTEPERRLITQAQQRRLHALFRENDLADREAGLLYIAAIIDRPLDSTKELTVDEARQVIDSLEKQDTSADEEPSLDLDGAE